MLVTDETPKAKKGVTWLIALAVVMAVAAIALAVAFAFNSASELHGFAAQDDTEAIEAASSNKPTVTNASTQVINLVGLMGLSPDDAVQKIGHGAAVQDEAPMSSVGFTDEETVVLTDEKGDALSGTPTVTLGFDANGAVAAASYSAPTSLLGYGNLSFADAVQKFHIVENLLGKVGLTGVEEGSVTLPDRKEYSSYGPDRKTLTSETHTFSGTAQADSAQYSWTATLDYDYAEANSTGDLANTVKKIAVSIMRS